VHVVAGVTVEQDFSAQAEATIGRIESDDVWAVGCACSSRYSGQYGTVALEPGTLVMSRTSVAAPPPPRRPGDTHNPNGAPRILVIEADGFAAAALQRMLRQLGYDAWAAASTARKALDLAAERTPDVVLAEVEIQGPLDGIDLAVELRQQHGTAIVFLTAHADDPTIERARRAEPSGYLIKPSSAAAVRAAIEIALDQREREDCIRALEGSLADTAIALLNALNHLPVAVQMEDSQGRVVHVNPGFRLMFGLDEGIDLMGIDSTALLRRVRAQCRDMEVFERIVESQRRSERSRIRETIRLFDGRRVELDFIRIMQGEQCRGQLWTFRDVSDPTRWVGAVT
jgi:CheY-like chemotaxis protein